MAQQEPTVIRMLVQIHRAAGLDDDRFYHHWQAVHGDIVRRHARATGVTRYVQSHRIASPEIDGFGAMRGWRAAPDGLAALSWPDLGTMLEHAKSDGAAAAGAELRADERLFADPSALCGLMAYPHTVFDHLEIPTHHEAPPVKMVIEVWRRPDLTPEAFRDRWRGAHAELAREVREAMGFARYVQNHRALDFPGDLAAARGWRPCPDGISEIWWPNQAAMLSALGSPAAAEASARLAVDETAFVEGARMSVFLSHEHQIFDRSSG